MEDTHWLSAYAGSNPAVHTIFLKGDVLLNKTMKRLTPIILMLMAYLAGNAKPTVIDTNPEPVTCEATIRTIEAEGIKIDQRYSQCIPGAKVVIYVPDYHGPEVRAINKNRQINEDYIERILSSNAGVRAIGLEGFVGDLPSDINIEQIRKRKEEIKSNLLQELNENVLLFKNMNEPRLDKIPSYLERIAIVMLNVKKYDINASSLDEYLSLVKGKADLFGLEDQLSLDTGHAIRIIDLINYISPHVDTLIGTLDHYIGYHKENEPALELRNNILQWRNDLENYHTKSVEHLQSQGITEDLDQEKIIRYLGTERSNSWAENVAGRRERIILTIGGANHNQSYSQALIGEDVSVIVIDNTEIIKHNN
jgi:hypothetical protein